MGSQYTIHTHTCNINISLKVSLDDNLCTMSSIHVLTIIIGDVSESLCLQNSSLTKNAAVSDDGAAVPRKIDQEPEYYEIADDNNEIIITGSRAGLSSHYETSDSENRQALSFVSVCVGRGRSYMQEDDVASWP